MPQIIGYIILIILIILLIVYVIIPLCIAAACLGAAYGLILSFYNLGIACYNGLFIRSNTITDNAYESYFYWNGDWGKNLKTVCKETFSLSYARASYFGALSLDPNLFWLLRIGFFFAMIASILGCVVFVPLLLLIFSAIFVIVWGLDNLFAYLFWGVERIWLYIRSIYAICPTCNKHVSHPTYYCPHCKAKHINLVPSPRFGIFNRTCSCGAKLPTLLLFGKGKLKGECPHCHASKGVSLDYTSHTIAFIGGKSVGKTFLRNVMCAQLPAYAKSKGWSTSVPPEEQNVVSTIVNELRAGRRPNETYLSSQAVAVRLGLLKSSFSVEERLYLYDAPGEAFEQEQHMKSYNYYEHLKTVVIVVDPLSLPSIRYRLSNNNTIIPHISQVSPVNCLQKWFNSIERIHSQGNLKAFLKRVRCCVVITKTDIPELHKIVKLHPGATSQQCKYFLENYGLPEIIPLVEDFFSVVKYFAVSCSGGKPDGVAFSPAGISNVWAWILDKQ